MSNLQFRPSEEFAAEAAAIYQTHRLRILERLSAADIGHTGATSASGVLTTGDVDIHVRVERVFFDHTRDVLAELYSPLYPEAWTDQSAFFVELQSDPRVEIALTAIDSKADLRHGEVWRYMASDSQLRTEYNALKVEYAGKDLGSYQLAKREFFERVIERLRPK